MKPPLREHLADHMIVWMARLSQAEGSLASVEFLLDARDRERAGRFRFPADRGRFVLGRALIRQSLGRFLEQAPESIKLAYTELGRPYFPHDRKIEFSISHTQDLVAIALTDGARIGIDLESVKNLPDLGELAERIFSPVDLETFRALSPPEKLASFYRAWTRKEAYLKARGEGIAEGLQQISVALGAAETLSITDTRAETSGRWRLVTLPVPDAYAGAVACDDVSRRLEGHFVRIDQGEVVTEPSF